MKDTLRTIALQKKSSAVPRQHAEAIKIEDLAQMMYWSESQVSSAEIDAMIRSGPPRTTEEKEKAKGLAKHVMTRAYSSTGFTLWLRYLVSSFPRLSNCCSRFYVAHRFFEQTGLRFRNIKLGCVDKAGNSYIEVFLERRKGWQAKQGFDSHSECIRS